MGRGKTPEGTRKHQFYLLSLAARKIRRMAALLQNIVFSNMEFDP